MRTALLTAMVLVSLASPCAVTAQFGPVFVSVGVLSPTHRSGDGMVGADVRAGLGPRRRAVRPVVGAAAAVTLYGTQTELQAGAQTETSLGDQWQAIGGGGLSYLRAEGGAAGGASGAAYVHAAVVYSGFRGPRVGLDVRLLAGPNRRRHDGLLDPVGFLQVGAAFAFGARP